MTDINAYDSAPEAQFGDYVALLKPRVMSLVVFTAFVGLIVAPIDVHPFIAFCSVLFIALGGGASGALNMWYDRDIDAVMNRTQSRPIPSGRVDGGEALGLGIVLGVISVMMLGLVANWFAALFLAFTIFFYAVVYTVWLKRWTPQNIVIGGAAGAFPPMIGWACATGGISIESVLMFALIFFWTPPHFWALALFMKEDYHKAGVPMLTVTHGRPVARRHIFAYTLVLAPFALWLGLTSVGGPLYMAVAVVLNLAFIRGGWQVLRRTEEAAVADGYLVEKRVFKLSLYYLFLHFLALLVQSWMGGW
ncbi:protoheme IX farnesyltransferase [Paracoccus aestuarii]|uniref:Protoheme IX farnesyltransferase n=1 Tax=Paracoccus aestuarii TaxID=453842 RepID=A0A418ZVK3_9RHOB|nr:heme o synthase [Paracoccus aestuarii]RJL03957.1 protoheme IX farnesyltransferase [Paracoccus aestuarii]WCQ98711.1 protoheme IX farnesyltransferase [Paracoccus aestuarii]